jgi:HEAT repeat protein
MTARHCFVALGVVVTLGLVSPCHAYDDVIDSPMYRDPQLPVPRVVMVFPEPTKVLWQKALDGPEAAVRCRAAETIALARRRGVKGLETTIDPLLAALDHLDQPPTVRLAVAQALIALDARSSAAALLRADKESGGDLRDLVEPALAKWAYIPARTLWLERLRDPAAPRRDLVLAIRGLAAVREGQAADRLRELVLTDRTPRQVRLEAARALGELRPDGLEKDAERLAADATPRGIGARLAAVALLHGHRGDDAVRLLQRLERDEEPAVVAAAVARLTEIDPRLVVPMLDHLLGSTDAKVRVLAVEVLFRLPTGPHLRLLGDRLDDEHPEVRLRARRALHDLAARKELREAVIAEGSRVLAADSWRGQEQAAILLTQLDHKPAAGRLIALLKSSRPEVLVTAAWGLRKLDVPDTLPEVADYVRSKLGDLLAARGPAEGVPYAAYDHQLSQLNQFLGQRTYAPADMLLRKFIPHRATSPVGPEERTAAIWALGRLHEGQAVPALATALVARLNDTRSIPPEETLVRQMSAITLGRMKAQSALASLRTYCPEQRAAAESVHNACGWAIEQITGETLAPPKTQEKLWPDWFLSPHD